MSAKSVGTVVESGAEVFIPLNKLKKSPKNARKTPHSEASIEAYAASIAAKGILQNLVVEPEVDADGAATGFYFVTIGEGRRLAQLLRVKRKEIKKAEPIRCIIDTANDPHEISLDENVTRENMHPADKFEAFKKLAEERAEEQICVSTRSARPGVQGARAAGTEGDHSRDWRKTTRVTAGRAGIAGEL